MNHPANHLSISDSLWNSQTLAFLSLHSLDCVIYKAIEKALPEILLQVDFPQV